MSNIVAMLQQRARVVARTVTLRQARLLIAQMYGTLYMWYGVKLPLVIMLRFMGRNPPTIDFMMKAVPYMPFAGIACAFFGALTGAGAAWIVTGRAMRSRKPHSLRWATVGALGAALPVIPLVAHFPEAPLLVVDGFLMLLCGAGMGFAFHWVVQRDRAAHGP